MHTSRYHIEEAERLLGQAKQLSQTDQAGSALAANLALLAAAHAQTARAMSARRISGEERGGGY